LRQTDRDDGQSDREQDKLERVEFHVFLTGLASYK
jgi:hypothetical protein